MKFKQSSHFHLLTPTMHCVVKLILKQKLSWQPRQGRWLRVKGAQLHSLLSAVTFNLQLRPGGPWQWQWEEVRAQPATGLHILQTKQTVTEGDAEKGENSEASSCSLGNLGSLSPGYVRNTSGLTLITNLGAWEYDRREILNCLLS